MTGTDLPSRRRNTGFVCGLTVARSTRPAFGTDALSAGAYTLLRSRAQQPSDAITREVITLAERAGDHLLRVHPLVAVTNSANALPPSAALDRRVRLTAILGKAGLRVDVRGRALALVPVVELVTVADAALVRSHPTALFGVLLVVRISRQFARTAAQHLDIDRQTLVDTDRVDLQDLVPVPWVLRALQ